MLFVISHRPRPVRIARCSLSCFNSTSTYAWNLPRRKMDRWRFPTGPTTNPTRQTWHHGQAILGDSTTSGIYTSLMSFACFAANIAEIWKKKSEQKSYTVNFGTSPTSLIPRPPEFPCFPRYSQDKTTMPWFLICQVWSLMIFPVGNRDVRIMSHYVT